MISLVSRIPLKNSVDELVFAKSIITFRIKIQATDTNII